VEERAICSRCGFSWVVNKNKRQKPRPLCRSCRARKAATVQEGEFRCLPWHGRFAQDMVTPIDDDGKEFMPGKRVCGNSDCVLDSHIEPND